MFASLYSITVTALVLVVITCDFIVNGYLPLISRELGSILEIGFALRVRIHVSRALYIALVCLQA